METFFIVCATVGCTVLVLQFLMNVLGFAGDMGDMGDGGGVDVDISGDIGDIGDVGDVADVDAGDVHHHHTGMTIAKVLTFQTIVAFFAFFGLGGWAALGAQQPPVFSVMIALAAGTASMFVVAYVFQGLRKLEASGTVQLSRALGCRGRVYLRIPADGTGVGKVTLTTQGRTIEVKARTPGPELKTGTNVKVSKILDRATVEVVDLATVVEEPASQSV